MSEMLNLAPFNPSPALCPVISESSKDNFEILIFDVIIVSSELIVIALFVPVISNACSTSSKL